MLLSICIPTHHGRGWCLKLAIDAFVDQIEHENLVGQVEICISDNASEDDTAEVVAEAIQRAPNIVTYDRFQLDTGNYNFQNVVRIAQGEYCWLFGSDDVPTDGAVRKVLNLLKRYPGCSGITADFIAYDFTLKIEQPNPGVVYPEDAAKERAFTNYFDALTQLGPAHTFMSVQIFRRELWLKTLETEKRNWPYIAPYHNHTYIFAKMLKSDPNWVWTPEKVVKMRGDNGNVEQQLPGESYSHSVRVLKDMVTIWCIAAGGDRRLFRSVLRRAYRQHWAGRTIRHHKMLKSNNASDDYKMLILFTRYLAGLPDFWWGAFPVLLTPHWLWKWIAAVRQSLSRT